MVGLQHGNGILIGFLHERLSLLELSPFNSPPVGELRAGELRTAGMPES
jgi:hypothetical protein